MNHPTPTYLEPSLVAGRLTMPVSARPWLRLALGFLAFTASGCGSGSVQETVEPAVSDSAGVQIVDNGSSGAHGDLVVRETLRLGVIEGNGPEQFNQVVAVELDDAGHIFVGNAGSTSVRVFDADGSFLNEFGRRGEGPSELRSLIGVFLADDMVALSGRAPLAKVVLFRRDGTFIDSWTAPKPDGSYAGPHTQGAGRLACECLGIQPPRACDR
jgi:hypothetical protein